MFTLKALPKPWKFYTAAGFTTKHSMFSLKVYPSNENFTQPLVKTPSFLSDITPLKETGLPCLQNVLIGNGAQQTYGHRDYLTKAAQGRIC